jgi:hypothetical protein
MHIKLCFGSKSPRREHHNQKVAQEARNSCQPEHARNHASHNGQKRPAALPKHITTTISPQKTLERRPQRYTIESQAEALPNLPVVDYSHVKLNILLTVCRHLVSIIDLLHRLLAYIDRKLKIKIKISLHLRPKPGFFAHQFSIPTSRKSTIKFIKILSTVNCPQNKQQLKP